MPTPFEIPLANPPQTFLTTLSGVTYSMAVLWRDDPAGGWFLDIADDQGVPIISGIALVTGADLLAQYAYLGIPGRLIVATDHATDAAPTFDNLGALSHLYYIAP